jgi:hypothetical protein
MYSFKLYSMHPPAHQTRRPPLCDSGGYKNSDLVFFRSLHVRCQHCSAASQRRPVHTSFGLPPHSGQLPHPARSSRRVDP